MAKEFSLAVLVIRGVVGFTVCTKGRLLSGGISGFLKVLGKRCLHCSEWILVIWKEFHCEVEDCAGEFVVSRPFEGWKNPTFSFLIN